MSDFWGKFGKTMDAFGDMMDSLGDYIEEEFKEAEKPVKKGFNLFKSNKMSKTTTYQNGHKIETIVINGKTTVKIDGKVYVPKEG